MQDDRMYSTPSFNEENIYAQLEDNSTQNISIDDIR